MADTLGQKELEERVSILKRFRELLLAQREKFNKYLIVLEKQKDDIKTEDVDKLVAHVEIEQEIVKEIFTFQKVIDPLEDMYRAAYPMSADAEIPELKASLDDLKTLVIEKNKENRSLLEQRMNMLRNEVLSLRNPYKKSNQVYGSESNASMIDIKG